MVLKTAQHSVENIVREVDITESACVVVVSDSGLRILAGVFFFQAEDGIRDLYVTGVQTCALPISGENESSTQTGAPMAPARCATAVSTLITRSSSATSAALSAKSASCGVKSITRNPRSEERRVGKEGRSRWSP